MIKIFYTLFFTTVLIFNIYTCFGQAATLPVTKSNADSSKTTNTSPFKIGIAYLSNNVFMGRTDTMRTPAIVPDVKYTLNCGVYFSGSLNFIPNRKKKKLDGGDISAGYDYDFTDDFSGTVSYTKLFFSSTSTQIAAAISSTVSSSFTYDIGDIISPTIGVDYNINRQGIDNDVFVNAGLTHDFIKKGIFGDKDFLLISPTITINSGSQNFYDAYLVKKNFKAAKKTAAQNALLTQYINQLGQFQLLDYEFSAPVEYKTGHFIFQFTPTYAVVKNQLPQAVAAKISDQSSIFYFQLGVSVKF